MKRKLLVLLTIIGLFSVLLGPGVAFAQGPQPPTPEPPFPGGEGGGPGGPAQNPDGLLGVVYSVNAYSAAATTTQTSSGWKVNNQNYGSKISMVSANDGWIVAFAGKTAYLYRWNGTTWTNAGTVTHTQDIVRGDIFMVSATDGWIVLGGPLSGGWPNLAQSVIYHWDGSTWTQFAIVTDPNAVSLSAIDMVSATDGWATASFNFGSHFYRWNGGAWQKFSSVWLPADVGNDIDMVSATDGWSVGFQGDIFRWNGSSWNEVTSPVSTSLNSITMVSATDGWIVGGGVWNGGIYDPTGVILRWNGSTWTQVSSPITTTLNSVAMVSATDGWAVGGGWNGTGDDPGVILHWDGNTWVQVASPTTAVLNAVAMVSAIDGWIAGDGATLRYEPTTLTINYSTGQSGSFFNITGSYFPASSPVNIVVNGHSLTSTVSTDASGVFTFTLSTDQANAGLYYVTASVNPNNATTSFTLSPTDPLHPREGNWTLVDVPAGIAFTQFLYLPLIQR